MATQQEVIDVLLKFADHGLSCKCTICRNLTDKERDILGSVIQRKWWQ